MHHVFTSFVQSFLQNENDASACDLDFNIYCPNCRDTQLAVTVICTCLVWLRFVEISAKINFCDLRRRVTLTFDVLTPKFIVSCPCLADHLCQFASESVHSFSKCRVCNLVTGELTDERMEAGKGRSRTLCLQHLEHESMSVKPSAMESYQPRRPEYNFQIHFVSLTSLVSIHLLIHLSTHLSHHPRSHHPSLLHSFTPGSKPTFTTNRSHFRLFLPIGLTA